MPLRQNPKSQNLQAKKKNKLKFFCLLENEFLCLYLSVWVREDAKFQRKESFSWIFDGWNRKTELFFFEQWILGKNFILVYVIPHKKKTKQKLEEFEVSHLHCPHQLFSFSCWMLQKRVVKSIRRSILEDASIDVWKIEKFWNKKGEAFTHAQTFC